VKLRRLLADSVSSSRAEPEPTSTVLEPNGKA
jgi:hypothetical protein